MKNLSQLRLQEALSIVQKQWEAIARIKEQYCWTLRQYRITVETAGNQDPVSKRWNVRLGGIRYCLETFGVEPEEFDRLDESPESQP